MTIAAPRVQALTLAEVNRSFQELATAVATEMRVLAIGEWRLLEVLTSETFSGFFPTSRRIYSVPTLDSVTTTRVRLYASGQTIVRHALGRQPRGYVSLGQVQAGSVSQLDVANSALVNPTLDPAEYVAFSAPDGLYTIAVVG